MGQPDNHHMDMRLAARLAAPAEGAVSEGHFEVTAVNQDRPQLRHLLALGDRIGGDKGDPDAVVSAKILPGTGRCPNGAEGSGALLIAYR